MEEKVKKITKKDFTLISISFISPILAVIIAFFLARSHEVNIGLTKDIQHLNDSQLSIKKDVDSLYKKVNILNTKQIQFDSKIYSIYTGYVKNKEFHERIDSLQNHFKAEMARTGNVMYSDRQELFYLIYRNTETIQFISGRMDIRSKISSRQLDNKRVRLPYDNYESLQK